MRRLREHGPLNVEARPKSYPVLSRGLKTIPACHCTIFTEGRSTWARPLCRREGPRSGHSSIPISHFEVDHILLNNGGGRRRLPSQSGKWCLTLIMSTKEKKGTKWERGEREEERLALLTRKERRGCSQTSQDYKVQRMVGLPTCCSRGLVGSVRVLPTCLLAFIYPPFCSIVVVFFNIPSPPSSSTSPSRGTLFTSSARPGMSRRSQNVRKRGLSCFLRGLIDKVIKFPTIYYVFD